MFLDSHEAAGLAVAVVREGEVVSRGFGVRDAGTGEPVTPDLLGRLSYELYVLGRSEEALAVRLRALAMWEALDDDAQVGDAQRWLSRMSWFVGRSPEAEQYAERACATLTGRGDLLEAMALSNRAQLRMLAFDLEGTRAWVGRALAITDTLPVNPETEAVRVHAMTNLGSMEVHGDDPERGWQLLDDSVRRSREAGFHDHAARAYTNIVASAVQLHDHQRTDAVLAVALDYCAERDLDHLSLYMRGWQAESLLARGDLEAALACAEAVLGDPNAAPISRMTPLAVVARARARVGVGDWCESLAEATALAEQTGEAQRVSLTVAAACEIAWLDGDKDAWEDAATRAWPVVGRSSSAWMRGIVTSWLPVLEPGEVEGLVGPCRAEAEGRWEDAAMLWSELGSRFAEGLAWARSGTREGLECAVACFEDQGAMRAAERARALLRVHKGSRAGGSSSSR